MFRSFFKSKRWSLWAYGGGLVLLLALFVQVELTVRLNEWYGRFYNILQKATEHKAGEFWAQMLVFWKNCLSLCTDCHDNCLFYQGLFF